MISIQIKQIPDFFTKKSHSVIQCDHSSELTHVWFWLLILSYGHFFCTSKNDAAGFLFSSIIKKISSILLHKYWEALTIKCNSLVESLVLCLCISFYTYICKTGASLYIYISMCHKLVISIFILDKNKMQLKIHHNT